jgi:hypothetical protein
MKNEEMVLRKRAHSFIDVVSGIKVRSQATLIRANVTILRIKEVRGEIKLFFADPIDKAHTAKYAAKEAYQSIVAKKDEVEEPLVNAEKAIKGKISVYLLAEEEKRAEAGRERDRVRREAEEKAEALRAKGHHEEADEVEDDAPAVYVKPKPQMTGLHSRENWLFRVIDLGKIPRKWLMLDEVAIRREVREKKGKTKIPGIEAYKDMIIAKSRG